MLKLDRLLAITMMLLQKKRISGQELADKFEVSLRTIYRDLECINRSGIPIVSFAGADGGYEIMDGYKLDRQYVTLDELISMVSALQGFHSLLEDQQISHLLDKVKALVGKSDQQLWEDGHRPVIVDFNPWGGSKQDQEKVRDIRYAIQHRRMIHFSYFNSQGVMSERSVQPLGLVLREYAWYLYGFCKIREDRRIFRLSRIQQWSVLAENFERNDSALQDWICQWGGSQNTVPFVLRFSPRAMVRVMDDFEPKHIQKHNDGYIYVHVHFPEDDWVYRMLLKYGADVKVIEPATVAERLRQQARAMWMLYEEEEEMHMH